MYPQNKGCYLLVVLSLQPPLFFSNGGSFSLGAAVFLSPQRKQVPKDLPFILYPWGITNKGNEFPAHYIIYDFWIFFTGIHQQNAGPPLHARASDKHPGRRVDQC